MAILARGVLGQRLGVSDRWLGLGGDCEGLGAEGGLAADEPDVVEGDAPHLL